MYYLCVESSSQKIHCLLWQVLNYGAYWFSTSAGVNKRQEICVCDIFLFDCLKQRRANVVSLLIMSLEFLTIRKIYDNAGVS